MSELDRLVAAGVVESGVRLGPLTTYKLGGPARYFAQPDDLDTLGAVVEARIADCVPTVVLGRGSNMVIADTGFEGLVIRLGSGFGRVEHLPDRIAAGAAVSLPVLARSAAAEGRLGLEFYIGIPGSVGGAVRQNAGCHGTETADVLIEAQVVRGHGAIEWVTPVELDLSYRHSNVSDHDIVANAMFSFHSGDRELGNERIREVTRWRKAHQPGGTLNAGSVFKNPPGAVAGRLIDRLGLKGLSVGGASVSDRHANFFVAGPGATASDVHTLVEEVRRIVADETGIVLEPEIRFVGFEEAE